MSGRRPARKALDAVHGVRAALLAAGFTKLMGGGREIFTRDTAAERILVSLKDGNVTVAKGPAGSKALSVTEYKRADRFSLALAAPTT